ncbi:MAG: hypothetical protein ACT4PO_03865 [Actinomycetota bacterium]
MRARIANENGDGHLAATVAALMVAGLIAVVPLVMLGRGTAERTQTGIDALGQANDAAAQAGLMTAIRAGQVYFAENGTFQGFDPAVAVSFDPSTVYNTSPVAVVGQISIRGVSPTTIVFATKSASGGTLCVGANFDLVTYGRTDVSSAAACTGDW